ncbi:MAG: hypothetical protein KBA26_09465 [Candidatus Delongbacteria bacterium]|nr:hypothetical protein [Candidatus Delongbacteria bacterium]
MPTSFPNQISTIIGIILRLAPDSILDIGPGYGKYGFLSREYLENWFGSGKLYQFTHRIDAIEFYQDYISPVHQFAYDHLYIGDAAEKIQELTHHYSLSIMIDIIEHFTLEDGHAIIKNLLSHSDNLIVSTPKNFIVQDAIYGNAKETHRSWWSKKEFLKIGRGLYFYDDDNLIWLYGKQLDSVIPFHRHQWLKHYLPISYQIYRNLIMKKK